MTAVTAVVSGALATTSTLSCDLRAWALFGVQLAFTVLAAALRPQRVPASNLITAVTALVITIGYLLCAIALAWEDAAAEELLAAAQSCAAIVSGLGLIATVRTGMRIVLVVVDKVVGFRQARRDAAKSGAPGPSGELLLTDALGALIPDYMLTAGRDGAGRRRDVGPVDDSLAVPMLTLPSADDRMSVDVCSVDPLEDVDPCFDGRRMCDAGDPDAERLAQSAAVDSIVRRVLAGAAMAYYNATGQCQPSALFNGASRPSIDPALVARPTSDTAADWEAGAAAHLHGVDDDDDDDDDDGDCGLYADLL
jgi:hypothetical protein